MGAYTVLYLLFSMYVCGAMCMWTVRYMEMFRMGFVRLVNARGGFVGYPGEMCWICNGDEKCECGLC